MDAARWTRARAGQLAGGASAVLVRLGGGGVRRAPLVTALWLLDLAQLVALPLALSGAGASGECAAPAPTATAQHARMLGGGDAPAPGGGDVATRPPVDVTCPTLAALRVATAVPFELRGSGHTALALPALVGVACALFATAGLLGWRAWQASAGARPVSAAGDGCLRVLLLLLGVSGVTSVLWAALDCYAPPGGGGGGGSHWLGGTGDDAWHQCADGGGALQVGGALLLLLHVAVCLPTSLLLAPSGSDGTAGAAAAAAAAIAAGAPFTASSHGRVAAAMLLLRHAAGLLYFRARHSGVAPVVVVGALTALGAAWLGSCVAWLPYVHQAANRAQCALAAVFLVSCVASLLDLGLGCNFDHAAVVVWAALAPPAAFCGWQLARVRFCALAEDADADDDAAAAEGADAPGGGSAGGGWLRAAASPYVTELRIAYLLSPDNPANHPAFHFPGGSGEGDGSGGVVVSRARALVPRGTLAAVRCALRRGLAAFPAHPMMHLVAARVQGDVLDNAQLETSHLHAAMALGAGSWVHADTRFLAWARLQRCAVAGGGCSRSLEQRIRLDVLLARVAAGVPAALRLVSACWSALAGPAPALEAVRRCGADVDAACGALEATLAEARRLAPTSGLVLRAEAVYASAIAGDGERAARLRCEAAQLEAAQGAHTRVQQQQQQQHAVATTATTTTTSPPWVVGASAELDLGASTVAVVQEACPLLAAGSDSGGVARLVAVNPAAAALFDLSPGDLMAAEGPVSGEGLLGVGGGGVRYSTPTSTATIASLLPAPLAALHEWHVMRFLRTGRTRMLGVPVCTLGVHAVGGHLLPLVACVRVVAAAVEDAGDTPGSMRVAAAFEAAHTTFSLLLFTAAPGTATASGDGSAPAAATPTATTAAAAAPSTTWVITGACERAASQLGLDPSSLARGGTVALHAVLYSRVPDKVVQRLLLHADAAVVAATSSPSSSATGGGGGGAGGGVGPASPSAGCTLTPAPASPGPDAAAVSKRHQRGADGGGGGVECSGGGRGCAGGALLDDEVDLVMTSSSGDQRPLHATARVQRLPQSPRQLQSGSPPPVYLLLFQLKPRVAEVTPRPASPRASPPAPSASSTSGALPARQAAAFTHARRATMGDVPSDLVDGGGAASWVAAGRGERLLQPWQPQQQPTTTTTTTSKTRLLGGGRTQRALTIGSVSALELLSPRHCHTKEGAACVVAVVPDGDDVGLDLDGPGVAALTSPATAAPAAPLARPSAAPASLHVPGQLDAAAAASTAAGAAAAAAGGSVRAAVAARSGAPEPGATRLMRAMALLCALAAALDVVGTALARNALARADVGLARVHDNGERLASAGRMYVAAQDLEHVHEGTLTCEALDCARALHRLRADTDRFDALHNALYLAVDGSLAAEAQLYTTRPSVALLDLVPDTFRSHDAFDATARLASLANAGSELVSTARALWRLNSTSAFAPGQSDGHAFWLQANGPTGIRLALNQSLTLALQRLATVVADAGQRAIVTASLTLGLVAAVTLLLLLPASLSLLASERAPLEVLLQVPPRVARAFSARASTLADSCAAATARGGGTVALEAVLLANNAETTSTRPRRGGDDDDDDATMQPTPPTADSARDSSCRSGLGSPPLSSRVSAGLPPGKVGAVTGRDRAGSGATRPRRCSVDVLPAASPRLQPPPWVPPSSSSSSSPQRRRCCTAAAVAATVAAAAKSRAWPLATLLWPAVVVAAFVAGRLAWRLSTHAELLAAGADVAWAQQLAGGVSQLGYHAEAMAGGCEPGFVAAHAAGVAAEISRVEFAAEAVLASSSGGGGGGGGAEEALARLFDTDGCVGSADHGALSEPPTLYSLEQCRRGFMQGVVGRGLTGALVELTRAGARCAAARVADAAAGGCAPRDLSGGADATLRALAQRFLASGLGRVVELRAADAHAAVGRAGSVDAGLTACALAALALAALAGVCRARAQRVDTAVKAARRLLLLLSPPPPSRAEELTPAGAPPARAS